VKTSFKVYSVLATPTCVGCGKVIIALRGKKESAIMGKVITASVFISMFNSTFRDRLEWMSEEVRDLTVDALTREGYDEDDLRRMSEAFAKLEEKSSDLIETDHASDLLNVDEESLDEGYYSDGEDE
jgi:hypothetical protein